MNYWYVARPNEIFIDTDNFERSMKHTKARLQGAIECGKLDVAYVMSRPSRSKNHIHTIITIVGDSSPDSNFFTTPTQRAIWEIVLHGDIYRGCCTLMRIEHGVPAPSVLISPYPTFICHYQDREHAPRLHDCKCDCVSKHTAAVMETCPAAIRLRGDKRSLTFFGKPSKNKCEVWP